jgi:hypothetical protein
MSTEKTVATPSHEQAEMVACSDVIRTLVRGTHAMREAGEKYLPKEPAESVAAYNVRKKRSVLFNATEKTIADMVGRVFVKDVVLKDDVPAAIRGGDTETDEGWAENIDNAGRCLNLFARDLFYDALQPGVSFIYVDMPPAIPGGTLADEQKAGIRPYMTIVPLERLIGWKSTTIAGAEKLTQIRIRECISEPDGEFDEKEVEQIRVVEPGAWRTYRENDKKDWVLFAEGTISITDDIALVPCYTNRTGFMCAKPPLQKLAELNVAHWQLDSDIQNIGHVACVPILFGAGFGENDTIAIGASEMVRSSDPNAKLSYVEHTGAAIGTAELRLTRLETQMQAMGLQMLVANGAHKTATGEIRADMTENSPLAMMAGGLEDAVEQALGFMARFANLGASGGSVEVNKPDGIQLGAATLQDLIAMCNGSLISKDTFWSECQRRGVLAEDFDAVVEKDRLDSQAPDLGANIPPGKGMDLNGGPPKPPALAKPGV